MNDQLNERLVSLLDYVGSVAKDADAFARAQLPDVAREIVAWELWSNVASAVWAAIVVFVAVRYGLKVFMHFRRVDPDVTHSPWPIALIPFILAVIVGPFVLADSASDAIKATVAPRLVILDYVKGVMK